MNQEAATNISGIHKLLFTGASISMNFDNAPAVASFRASLARHKSKQDGVLKGLGLLSIEEETILSFIKDKEAADSGILRFVIAYKEKKPSKQFSFQIVEDVAPGSVQEEDDL